MALRFNTSEQALYDAAKNIAEIEIRRIRTPGGAIDPVMRHTHDRIRDTLNAHTAPREWLAVAIGTAEGQLTGMAIPDALATEAIQRLRLQMEGLPEVVTPPPPGTPDAPDAETPTPIKRWYTPWRLKADDIRITGISKYSATKKPQIRLPEFNPVGQKAIIGNGVRNFFLERRLKPFQAAVAHEASPATPPAPAASA